MILTGKYETHMFIYFSLTRDIHLQNKLRKRTNYGVSCDCGLKKSMENDIFWSEVGSGF